MNRRYELALLLAAGCNSVFGLDPTVIADGALDDSQLPIDRDRDGIPDFRDPCIAGITDYKLDLEYDGFENDMDPCPLDYSFNDQDGDKIDDDCDPLPLLGGDRRRCFMAFFNPTINRELWTSRGDLAVWHQLLDGMRGTGTGVVVAGDSFEAAVTTSYELAFSATAIGSVGSMTLWIRTTKAGGAGDIGCKVTGDVSMSTLTLVGSQPPMSVTTPDALFGIRRLDVVVIANAPPGTKNVRCTARGSGVYEVSASVVLPPGTFGLGVDAADVGFEGLLVFERDDQPSL